ncbi:MAG: peptidoglycan-binding protein [Acidobacteriia bacterium]|nr:peptidoglycan-binding protein [Terriglobia bacterium]
MDYPYLAQGDHLPVVGVLQKLLNRTGSSLDADGIFGPVTRTALVAFQRARHMPTTGVVDQATWTRLVSGVDLPIVDCIDVWDRALWVMEQRDIRAVGGSPILIGGACNGVDQIVSDICSRARNVFLLRFHGHGAPGVASVATGQGELDPSSQERSDITSDSRTMSVLSRLRSVFGPYGCVQFMHCETAGGQAGRRLLSRIAHAMQVPATAAIREQLGGGLNTFRFEGPTVTELPSSTLHQWCRTRPDFPGYSVA